MILSGSRAALVSGAGSAGERFLGAAGLVALSPLILAVAVALRIGQGAGIVFRQRRVGRRGAPFTILKFRSMQQGGGPRITSTGDRRLTPLGAFLRRYKLDELLQLWNVVKGEMSLIGPRPEVPEFVDLEDPVWQVVLSVRPGITDLASLIYRDEEKMLARVEAGEQYYRDVVLPAKLRLNLEYMGRRSLLLDLKLILLTLRYSFIPRGFDPERIRRAFSPGAPA